VQAKRILALVFIVFLKFVSYATDASILKSTTDSLSYFNKLISDYESSNDRLKLTEVLLAKAQFLYKHKDFDNALIEANQALLVALDLGRDQHTEKAYFLLSQIHLSKNIIYEAIDYLYPGYMLSQSIRDSSKIKWYLLTISEAEEQLGRLTNAIEINLAAINFFKKNKDTINLARIFRSQGAIHNEFGNYATAQSYLEKSIAILLSSTDSLYLGKCYRDLAYNQLLQGKYLLAERHLNKSESFLAKVDTKELLRVKATRAEMLLKQNRVDESKQLLKEVEREQELTNDKFGLIHTLLLLGRVQISQGSYIEAYTYLNRCVRLAKELNMAHISRQVFRKLSLIEEQRGNISSAYRYLQRYVILTDSLFNIQKISEANRLENISAIHQKEKELQAQKETLLVNEAKLNKSRYRQIFLFGIILFLLAMIAISYNAYRNKRKANSLLSKQNLKIEKQRAMLEQRSRDITDSLNYARRIQKAILQTSEKPQQFFPESFLIFIPRELVSGDFYWFKKIDDIILFAVADCTGHGAPGAFMSIIGMFGLNQIVTEYKVTYPGEVLQNLNELFHTLFDQKEGSEIFDGMDIGFCSYNIKTKELRFAGANIYLNVVRKSSEPPVSGTILHKNSNFSLYQIKCERISLGYTTEKVMFQTHSIQLVSGDVLYLYTDGYTDQFGGAMGKKFRPTEFRSILCDIADLPLIKQKDYLLETFTLWKGENIQVDDVTVLGVRIT